MIRRVRAIAARSTIHRSHAARATAASSACSASAAIRITTSSSRGFRVRRAGISRRCRWCGSIARRRRSASSSRTRRATADGRSLTPTSAPSPTSTSITRLLSSQGGSVVAQCTGSRGAGQVYLVSWSPAQGYTVDQVQRPAGLDVAVVADNAKPGTPWMHLLAEATR